MRGDTLFFNGDAFTIGLTLRAFARLELHRVHHRVSHAEAKAAIIPSVPPLVFDPSHYRSSLNCITPISLVQPMGTPFWKVDHSIQTPVRAKRRW